MKFQQLRRLFLDAGDFKLIVYSLQETDNCPYLAGEAHQRASPDGSGGRADGWEYCRITNVTV